MILDDLNIKEFGKPYEKLTIRSESNLKCDYCGVNFKRIKKSRERLNKIISKDSCGEKDCKKKKKEEVNKKLYGTDNYFQSKDFIQKTHETNLKKYKSKNYLSSKDFKDKREKTLVARYGVKSPLQNNEIRQKQKETCLKKYNTDNFAKTDEFVKKYKTTSNKNYGCDFPINSIEIKKKNLKKYGCEYSLGSKKIRKKINDSYLKNHGVSHPSKSKIIRLKTKETNLKKYGCEFPSTSTEVKNKIKNTILEKYGYDCTFKCPQIQEKIKKTNLKKYGQERFKYGKTQKSITDWLNSYNFNFSSNFKVLEGQELDIYDENKKLAIEYCGIYWHNEESPEPRTRTYHYNKHKKCKDKGIQLLTIFDDEWNNKQNIIRSVILSKLGIFDIRIYARKCFVKQIDKKTFCDFCDRHHIQGKNSLSLVCFGLFYNDELIGAMDLGRHHRKNEKDSLVLTRLCFKKYYQIIGGSSKLFSAVVNYCKDNNIKNIVSWSDNRWSDGKIYKNLGFVLQEELGPDYCYVDMKNPKKRMSKQSQKKSNSNCPKDLTELEWAKSRGLSRIWDCGKTRWIFNI